MSFQPSVRNGVEASSIMPSQSPGSVRGARSIDDLDGAICRLSRHLNSRTYDLLLLVREFDDRFGWKKWSFNSCAEWLSWRCQFSLSASREKVRTAHALRHLPVISAAFAAGRLSYSKARALTRVADQHNEDLLLAYALDSTAAQVEERCQQMRNVAPESSASARRTWERRSLSVTRHPGRNTMRIMVEVPAEDGEVIARAIESAVAAGGVALGTDHVAAHGVAEGEDARDGWRAQQADALVAIAKAYLAGNAAATSVADHYQVVVHVDAEALSGGAGRSDLPLDTIKRITCDGNLIALVEDGEGAPLALGRKQRVVSTAIKRALWSRDRGCTFPGCHRRHYVDAHHILHWANGGETSLDNLTLLCSYHHRLLHEGSFHIRRREDRKLEFQRADGRVIPRGGYRLEDMLDDDVEEQEPSAEVREAVGVYRVALRLQAALS